MERQTKRTAAKAAAPKPKAAPKRAAKAGTATTPAAAKIATNRAPAVNNTGLPQRKAPAKKKAAKGPSKAAAALLKVVERSLDDDQAVDVSIIDLAGKTSIADYMVVASGRSQRQVGAMAEHLAKRIKTEGFGRAHLEGMPQNDWVLVDAGDVIVHLFRPEVRTFYNLEKMWSADFDAEAEAATGS
jgi:ribosome-associated protein